MARITFVFVSLCVWLTVFAATPPTLRALQTFQGVSLKVSKETAPPGGMAQMKVFITEPKPISTGSGSFSFAAYEDVEGIALVNDLEDVAGVALVRGTDVSLSFVSPSATFGMDADYPVITVAGHIPASAVIGVKYPLTIDASSLQLLDPTGGVYPVEAKPGHLITWPGVSIHDVNPGSATVPAGGVVTLSGSSFVPGTRIRFAEAKLSQVRYISPNRIDVVVAGQTRMHGMMIKASNPDDSQSTYFSYQRTRAMSPSVDPTLQYAVPLPPPHDVNTAWIDVPAPLGQTTVGLGVQNVQPMDAVVSVELTDAYGNMLDKTSLTVSPNRFMVRELSEIFGFAPGAASTVHISSGVPIQVIGLTAHQATGTATPILAR